MTKSNSHTEGVGHEAQHLVLLSQMATKSGKKRGGEKLSRFARSEWLGML